MEDKLVRLAVERLAEDETLREDLTDRGYAALLDWAFALVPHLAARALSQGKDAEQQMSAYTDQLRRIVREAARVASSKAVSDLEQVLGPPALSQSETQRARDALEGIALADNPDENAVRLAAAFWTVLEGPRSGLAEASEADSVISEDEDS